MTMPEWLDPVFISNAATIVLTFVFLFLSIKQRVKIVIDSLKSIQKDKEIQEKDAIILEQTEEIKVASSAMSSMVDILNMVVQASKMSAVDKAAVMETATRHKTMLIEFAEQKEQRLEEFRLKLKEMRENPVESAQMLATLGGSILEKYTQNAPKQ